MGPGNQGRTLTKREVIGLKGCIRVSEMPIHSQDFIEDEFERVYQREFQIQTNKDKNISACMRYMWKKAQKKFEVSHLKDEIRMFTGNL
mmetsp:Transcript_32532/g.49759  ORF Transcript_32532/g.49759 Transcript_32532/m.49759 type:complete len:89 (+) Transcript_32532:946-1212(+)